MSDTEEKLDEETTEETPEEETTEETPEETQTDDIRDVVATAIAELKAQHEKEMAELRSQLEAEFRAKILEMFVTPVETTEAEPEVEAEPETPETIDDLFSIVEE